MNTVGKIFVVLILGASLSMLSLAIVVTAPHPDWNKIANRPRSEVGPGAPLGLVYQLEDANATKARLEAERDTLIAELARIDLDSETSPYRRRTRAIQTEVGELQVENNTLSNAIVGDTSEVRLNTAKVKVEQRRLSKGVDEMGRLLAQLQDLLERRDRRQANLVARQDEVNSLTDRIAQVDRFVRRGAEWVSELRSMLVAHGIDPDADPSGAGPQVSGVITSIGKNQLIEISIGADDGLTEGHTIEIHRSGKYLGRATVLRTEPDKAVARLIKDYRKAPLQVGDRVSTRLKIS